jgi:hypothetical protein
MPPLRTKIAAGTIASEPDAKSSDTLSEPHTAMLSQHLRILIYYVQAHMTKLTTTELL